MLSCGKPKLFLPLLSSLRQLYQLPLMFSIKMHWPYFPFGAWCSKNTILKFRSAFDPWLKKSRSGQFLRQRWWRGCKVCLVSLLGTKLNKKDQMKKTTTNHNFTILKEVTYCYMNHCICILLDNFDILPYTPQYIEKSESHRPKSHLIFSLFSKTQRVYAFIFGDECNFYYSVNN